MQKLIIPLLIAGLCSPAWPDAPALQPQIQKVLSDIQRGAAQQHIEKLVSFGTRHTLSDTASDTRGIGAARRWIKSEMENVRPKAMGA